MQCQTKTNVSAAKQQFVPIFNISARHHVAPTVAALKSSDASIKVIESFRVCLMPRAQDEDKNRDHSCSQAAKSVFAASDKLNARKSVITCAAPLAAGSGELLSRSREATAS
jgi:hypothetical protein